MYEISMRFFIFVEIADLICYDNVTESNIP